jgi:putative transferase (TIGR04331 family)
LTIQKRYLITTADEKTWKYDQPVIFLGEWCRLYDRKHIWQKVDDLIAKPYGLDKSKKEADFSKIRELEQKLFAEFSQILNHHHNTFHNERFWQILLGHWLRRILELLINRINTLKQCFELYKISGTTVYKHAADLASIDSTHINSACIDDSWNISLNARIIDLLKVDFPVEFLQDEHNPKANSDISNRPLKNNQSIKMRISNLCLNYYNKISRRFLNDNDAFIINSYLPQRMEIKLELALKQLPQIWKLQRRDHDLQEIIKVSDKLLREKLTKKFTYKSACDIENIVRSLLFELLPICYLEGFKGLEKLANQQPWPKSPKFIFTSNNFDTDEVFKLWTASKVELGFKYFVGQHGNNYGTEKNYSHRIEMLTSDKFITWGYNKLPCHEPAFMFKTAGVKKKIYNSEGGLVLIEICHPGSYETQDVESEHINYFNDQKEFVKKLNDDIKKKLTIRLHSSYKMFRWSEKKRWFDFDPLLKLETGKININKLISKNRLVVHSYDSTGILETLSQNIPTLAFWQNGFDHLENNAIPNYQALVDAGIIHFSPKSVANKVNAIWNDVDGWWSQSHVQKARKEFCELYAKTSHNPLSELKRILLS